MFSRHTKPSDSVEEQSRFMVHHSTNSVKSEVQRATTEALLRYGRFRTVQSTDQADIIVQPRVAGMVVWGDWSRSDEQLSDIYGDFALKRLLDVSREGVDLFVTLVFTEVETGAGIASSQALARLSSRRGGLIENARSRDHSGHERVDVRNAIISEERLPQVVSRAVRAALVTSFPVSIGSSESQGERVRRLREANWSLDDVSLTGTPVRALFNEHTSNASNV